MSTNRETKRDAFGTLLSSALVGAGKPAQAFYCYPVGDFGGQSPVVVMASNGTEYEARAVTSVRKNTFYYVIYTFTLWGEAGTAWGEDDAEDRIDLLEKTIRETISDNLSTDDWAFIGYDGRTTVDTVIIAGEEYKRESIPVFIDVYDD